MARDDRNAPALSGIVVQCQEERSQSSNKATAMNIRTKHEVGNVQGVLDGDLDGFVRAELLRRAGSANGG